MKIEFSKNKFKVDDIQNFLQNFFKTNAKFLLEYRTNKINAASDVSLTEQYIIELREFDASFLHVGGEYEGDDAEIKLNSEWRKFVYKMLSDPAEKQKYKEKIKEIVAQNSSNVNSL